MNIHYSFIFIFIHASFQRNTKERFPSSLSFILSSVFFSSVQLLFISCCSASSVVVHQLLFSIISLSLYLVYIWCICIYSVYLVYIWLYINFGPKLAYIEQLLSSIIMLANLKPIYLHYLYLNMEL